MRRSLLLVVLLAATLPTLAPGTTACHPALSLSSGSSLHAASSAPDGPHKGPADVHWDGCDHWPEWVCIHTRAHDECVRTG